MENAGGRAGANKSARWRKIWTRRLQIFRRSPRRRREMHERAFGMVQGGSIARRQGLSHGFRQGQDDEQPPCHRRGQKQKATGTLITFLPDPTIFTITTEFKFERL